MTTEQGGVFDLGSYNDLTGKAAGTTNQNTLQVGSADQPLIVKLAFDPRWGARATFLETWYHTYHSQYNDDPKSKRRFLCRKNFGEKCPVCDAYWAIWNDNKKTGNRDSNKSLLDMFKSTNRSWIIVVQPNSDSVKATNITFSLQRILFGGKDKSGKPVKGLVNEMREKGRSPFDLKSNRGWIRLWKTGEGLGTEYFATEAFESVVEEVDGEEVEKRKFFLANVGQKIFSLSLEDIPVAIDCEHENSKWTLEEVAEYAKTEGVARPDRVMQHSTDSGANASNTGPAKEQEFTKVADFETPPWAVKEEAKEEEVPFAPAPVAKKVEKVEPIPHLESVVAKTTPVAPPVQQAKVVQSAPVAKKERKIIDDLDDLT